MTNDHVYVGYCKLFLDNMILTTANSTLLSMIMFTFHNLRKNKQVCGDKAILLPLNLRTRGGDPRSLPILNTLEKVGLNSQTLWMAQRSHQVKAAECKTTNYHRSMKYWNVRKIPETIKASLRLDSTSELNSVPKKWGSAVWRDYSRNTRTNGYGVHLL